VRLYLAGKASCWHAGVLLAAPTVKMLMTMDNAPLWCHFLVYFNTNKHNALRHWIEHVKTSRTVLFQLWKWSF
jgi:hypothetical protein